MITPINLAGTAPALGTAQPLFDARMARDFEAMVLRPMVQSMLPESEAVFGAGHGADVWKSFFADAIAGELAEHGGLGIARFLPGQGRAAE
jgi:peptidoglycan hydrolase FlgJ